MQTSRVVTAFAAIAAVSFGGCTGADTEKPSDASARVARYTSFALTIESSALTP